MQGDFYNFHVHVIPVHHIGDVWPSHSWESMQINTFKCQFEFNEQREALFRVIDMPPVIW